MKRLLVVAVLSLTGVFLFTSLAVGQSGATNSSTSSKVLPKRDKTKPYKFKTSGKVNFPSSFCAPNASNANCLPLRCAPGVRDARYCSRPTLAQVCTGKLRIVFRQGSRTRSSKVANLTANCTYSLSTTISRKGKLTVTVRFGGNTILRGSSASPKRVRAG